jgi:hypothetical protein
MNSTGRTPMNNVLMVDRDRLLNYTLLQPVYKEVPSILSLMDNRRNSETFGCFYPLFWKEWKVDFSNARAQEAALTLAMLYSEKYLGNPYYMKRELLECAMAGIEYWTKLQHKDGSFDEWRRFEHGQAATAFSVVAIASAYELIGDRLNAGLRGTCLECFRKSADFLAKNSDLAYVNHEGVSTYAVYLCYRILKNRGYLEILRKKIIDIGRSQSPEGWFREGSGPDTGYNTVTLSYLALYYKRSKDDLIFPVLRRAVEFNSYFLYPDGFTGGGFNSRSAGMLFPLGFVVLAERLAIARRLAVASLFSLRNGRMDGLFNLTNQRKCITLYTLLWAYEGAKESLPKLVHCDFFVPNRESFAKYMTQARILLVKMPSYYLAIGTKNGCIGALYSYEANRTLMMSSPLQYNSASGIFGRTADCTDLLGFYTVCRRESMKGNSILLRLSVSAVGKFETDAKSESRMIKRLPDPLMLGYHWISELGLRHRALRLYEIGSSLGGIHKRPSKPLARLDRRITWENDKIEIENTLTSIQGKTFKQFYVVESLILPNGENLEIEKEANCLYYVVEGRRVMAMKTEGDGEIQLESGDEAALAFNFARAVFVLIPLRVKNDEAENRYSLILNSSSM